MELNVNDVQAAVQTHTLTSSTTIALRLVWKKYEGETVTSEEKEQTDVLPLTYQGGDTWTFPDPSYGLFKHKPMEPNWGVKELVLILHGKTISSNSSSSSISSSSSNGQVTGQFTGQVTTFDICGECDHIVTSNRIHGPALGFTFSDVSKQCAFVIMETSEEPSHNDEGPVDDDVIESKLYPANSLFLRFTPKKLNFENNVFKRVFDSVETHEIMPFILRSDNISLTCEASKDTVYSTPAYEIVKRKRNAARNAALTLIAIRYLRPTIYNLINKCPKEIVKMIAQKVWDTRLDSCWEKTLRKQRKTKNARTNK